MQRVFFLLFSIFLSLNAKDQLDSPKDIEKEIDNLLSNVVNPKSCTVEREELCKVLVGFQKASDELPKGIERSFSVGRLFSAHMTFRQTWQYGRNWFAIYLKTENEKLSSNGFRVESESEQEIEDTKKLISQIENGKLDPENSLFKFLSEHGNTISLTECKKYVRTYQCEGDKKQFKEIYIRFTKDSIYVLTFGMVSKMKGSWDQVPGFYFSRLPLPKNKLI